MSLIYSITVVVFFSLFLNKQIKKYSTFFYSIALIIASITTYYEILRMFSNVQLTGFLYYLEKSSIKGLMSVGFFILVMYAGALNVKYSLAKILIKTRAELAIIASILLLPHCIVYLIGFTRGFSRIIKNPMASIGYISFVIVGLIGFIIMIPLFITSFKKIRSKMTVSNWKKLQKKAYIFYFLTYLHIFIILIKKDNIDVLKLSIYTIIFVGYGILKLLKFRKSKTPISSKSHSLG